jgi:hypothetical protein
LLSTAAIVGSVALLLCLTALSDAYAHPVRGGFASRQPDYVLAIVMTSVAAFGLIPFTGKRIGFRLSVSLLLGSLVVLVFSAFGYAGWYLGLSDPPFSNLAVSMHLLLVSLVGSIGGAIFTAYHFWAVRPYLKSKVTKS